MGAELLKITSKGEKPVQQVQGQRQDHRQPELGMNMPMMCSAFDTSMWLGYGPEGLGLGLLRLFHEAMRVAFLYRVPAAATQKAKGPA